MNTIRQEMEHAVARHANPAEQTGPVGDVQVSDRADSPLRDNEARYRTFVDYATDAFFLLRDGDGTILDVNDQACRSLGYTRDELIGATPALFGTRGDPDQLAEILLRVRQEETVTFDSWHCRKDGSKFPVEVRLRAFQIEGRRMALAFARDMTERVLVENALRESEQRFRQLAESAFEGLIIHDRGLVLDVNHAFAKLFGFASAEAMIGKSCFSDAPLTPASMNALRMQLQNPRAEIIEFDAIMPDGTVRVFETQGRELAYQGRNARVVAIRDITESKNREKSLQLFRTLIDRLDDAIEVIDAPTGRFLDVNDRGCLDLGYSREELLSLTVSDIDPLVPMSVYQQNLKKLRDSGNFKLESVHRRRDGSCFPVEINVRLVRLDREYMLAVVRDISERKLMEEELRRQQAQLTELALATPATIYMFRRRADGTSCLPYATPGIESIFGIPAADLTEDMSPAFAVIHPADIDAVNASIVESMRNMSRWHCEFRVLHAVKGEIWVEGSSVPSQEPDGSILWHGFVNDVSDRKRLEEQLRQSQKLEAVGRLAGGIAHDFNNLLTVVNGYSRHLLDKATSDHSVHVGLTAIHEAGQRAASLVRQLLAFSRGQASQPVVLNLHDVILQNENLLRQLLAKQIHLAILCEPDLAPIRVDRSQMEQVLMNLVVNARDAMPQGGCLTIRAGNLQLSERRIGVGCDLRPGRYVRISVADTGHGMTDDVKAKIFEPFFTTKEVGKGTGLGLPVVHGIVQQNGGQIEVTSEVGEGSCFSILLPAEPA